MPPASAPCRRPFARLEQCRLPVAGIPAKIMADRLGHSSVMLTLDTYSHVTPAMDHAAAELIAGLVPPATELPLARCEPRAEGQDPGQEEKRQKARSDGMGRRGIEPRTRGLKVLATRCRAVTADVG